MKKNPLYGVVVFVLLHVCSLARGDALSDALALDGLNRNLSDLLRKTDQTIYEIRGRADGDDSDLQAISDRAIHLVKRGANPTMSSVDFDGKKTCYSLLSVAVFNGYVELVGAMLDARPGEFPRVGKDADANQCIHFLKLQASTGLIETVLSAAVTGEACGSYCPKKKANMDAMAILLIERGHPLPDKEKLLLLAGQKNFPRTMGRLVEAGADISKTMDLVGNDDVAVRIARVSGSAGQVALSNYENKKRQVVADAAQRDRQTQDAKERKRANEEARSNEELRHLQRLGNCKLGATVQHREKWSTRTSSGNGLADLVFDASIKEEFVIVYDAVVEGFVGDKVKVTINSYRVMQAKGGGLLQPKTYRGADLSNYADKYIGKVQFYDRSRCN